MHNVFEDIVKNQLFFGQESKLIISQQIILIQRWLNNGISDHHGSISQ